MLILYHAQTHFVFYSRLWVLAERLALVALWLALIRLAICLTSESATLLPKSLL